MIYNLNKQATYKVIVNAKKNPSKHFMFLDLLRRIKDSPKNHTITHVIFSE
jgi:hypothetical protein